MYHQQSRGRGRGRGFRGIPRGQGPHQHGRGGWGGGGRVPIPSYQLSLPTAPHPLNAAWLDKVADAWRDGGAGAGSSLPGVLWDSFSSTSQPYLRLLDLVMFSPDYNKNRPDGLTAAVLNSYRAWLEDTYGGVRNVPHSLISDKVRQLAFKAMGGQECSYISDAIVEVCDLTRSSHMFVDDIHKMLNAKDFKKACQLATRLRLHDQFGVDAFVTPLVLLDRANVAELFLAESRPHQTAAVTALDDMLERSLPVVASNLGVPSFAKDTVNQKTLKKLIERWCKRFGLEVRQAAPNTALFSARATMNYLFYRRFKENSIRPDDCEDFLVDILADYPELVNDALDRVAREGALRTTVNVALTLGVPSRELPPGVAQFYHRPQDAVDEDQEGQCSPAGLPDDFYRMPDSVRVVLVDRADQLPSVCHELEYYTGPLGMDAEWKPISVRDVTAVALLQVATSQMVYVFDLIQLGKGSPWMERLGKAILCGNNLKLGFDLLSDFDMLETSVPSFSKAIMTKKNMMDIKILSNRIEAAFPNIFPFKEAPAPAPASRAQDGGAGRRKPKDVAKGLSELVRKCVGRPLDKGEQCSNWNRRPLRASQLQYAATDAFCLVDVYTVLRDKLWAQESTTPEEVLKCIITDSSGTPGRPTATAGRGKQKKKATPAANRGQELLENAPPPNARAIRPDAFRAVCDTMVQGLGKKLRSIGADTVILENGDDHDTCVTLARREGRIILTRGRALHRRMAGMVPRGHCYRVETERAADQLDEVVRHFRIDVAPEDVFKRCQYCNCADYWRVPSGVMRCLRDRLVLAGGRGDASPRPDWHQLEAEGSTMVDLNSGAISDCSVFVEAAAIHTSTLDATDTFYVCQSCGHVYWAGSHHGKYVAGLGRIVGGGYEGACGGPTAAESAPARHATMSMACDSDSDSEDY